MAVRRPLEARQGRHDRARRPLRPARAPPPQHALPRARRRAHQRRAGRLRRADGTLSPHRPAGPGVPRAGHDLRAARHEAARHARALLRRAIARPRRAPAGVSPAAAHPARRLPRGRHPARAAARSDERARLLPRAHPRPVGPGRRCSTRAAAPAAWTFRRARPPARPRASPPRSRSRTSPPSASPPRPRVIRRHRHEEDVEVGMPALVARPAHDRARARHADRRLQLRTRSASSGSDAKQS